MGAVLAGLAVGSEAKFTEGSASVEDAGKSFAVAMADVDADGDLDIFVTNSGSANRLYINNAGSFTEMSTKAGLHDEGASRGAVFADVNGDGLLDLYVTDASAANHLYIGDGKGNFKDTTAVAGVGDANTGQGACFADVDGDGDMDLFVANFGQSNVLYINDGKGMFKDGTAEAGLTSGSNSGFGCAFGDVDEDGDLDLYVTNSGQHSKLYVNDGKGIFSDGTSAAGIKDGTGQKRAVSFADLNGDGHLDLYYVGPVIDNQLFLGDGKGHFIDGTHEAGVAGNKAAQGMNIADVDGDGDLDIMVTNIGLPHILYENDGKGHFKDIASEAGVDYHQFGQGVAFGDIDNDGDLDMYVCNYGDLLTHKNELLINGANVGKWLKVRAVNGNGQANLYGAEVRVFEAGSQKQVGVKAQVDGGSAFASQNAYDILFGLSSSSASKFDVEIRCGGSWIGKDSDVALGGVAPNQIVKATCGKSATSVIV